MMAVETNKGDNVSPSQTLTGVAPGVGAANGKARRKRPSSLMSAATSLPSVESSLDEFISRANQTLTDANSWNAAEVAAKQEDESRRENDQLRMRAAEQQLREGEAREQSLRRQLDGLQGRLAEAEARAAVAGSGSQDGVIADLKFRLTRADERIANAEGHAQQADARVDQLAQELTAAKAAVPATPSGQFFQAPSEDADERVRVAEAKAAKALAAAKAAAAGLTVSQADIAAIESGLGVPSLDAPKGTNWLAVAGAFIGGLAIMFGVSKVLQKNEAAPVQAAAAVAPAPAAAPTKPIVTPIEDDKPAANAQAAQPTAAPAGDVKAAEAAAPGEEPKAAPAEPVTEAKAAPVAQKAEPKHAAPKHAAAPAHKGQPAAAASGGIADPFGDSGTAKKAPAKKPADKKPAGAIVDPF
jgi:hypothetical protein